MIKFKLTQEKDTKHNFDNKCQLGKYTLHYENAVQVFENNKFIIFFCGILWQGNEEQFSEKDFVPNGQFYCIEFCKKTKNIRIFTDFLEDFGVFYAKKPFIQITNSLIDFTESTINHKWIKLAHDHGVYIDKLIDYNNKLPKLWSNDSFNSDIWYKNLTVLNDTYRVGPGRILKLDQNSNISFEKYYDHISDYYNLMTSQPQYNSQSAYTYANNIIKQNLDLISKKYKNIAIQSSNGVDSLVILSMLPDKKVIGYLGENYQKENPAKIRKLYDYLPNSILHFFDADEYHKAYYSDIENWCIPSRNADLAPERYVIEKYLDKKDVIIKGTFGDEIFWHDPLSADSVCRHIYNITDHKESLDFLKNHYSYQPYHSDVNFFNLISKLSFNDSVMYYHYHRQSSYLKDDRILNNRLIFSPYIDIRLRKLLPLCDLDTKVSSILDASIQKKMITANLITFLNENKSGGEESFESIDYEKIKKDQLQSFCNKIINKQSNIF